MTVSEPSNSEQQTRNIHPVNIRHGANNFNNVYMGFLKCFAHVNGQTHADVR